MQFPIIPGLGPLNARAGWAPELSGIAFARELHLRVNTVPTMAFFRDRIRVGLGKLYNILAVASKLHNFHNLRTIAYVMLRLKLKEIVYLFHLIILSIYLLLQLLITFLINLSLLYHRYKLYQTPLNRKMKLLKNYFISSLIFYSRILAKYINIIIKK